MDTNMSFTDFVKVFQAYQAFLKMTPAGAPAQTPAGAPVQTPAEVPAQTPAGVPAGAPAQTPEGVPAQNQGADYDALLKRLDALERRQINPSIPSVEPQGLNDVVNRMLGDF